MTAATTTRRRAPSPTPPSPDPGRLNRYEAAAADGGHQRAITTAATGLAVEEPAFSKHSQRESQA